MPASGPGFAGRGPSSCSLQPGRLTRSHASSRYLIPFRWVIPPANRNVHDDSWLFSARAAGTGGSRPRRGSRGSCARASRVTPASRRCAPRAPGSGPPARGRGAAAGAASRARRGRARRRPGRAGRTPARPRPRGRAPRPPRGRRHGPWRERSGCRAVGREAASPPEPTSLKTSTAAGRRRPTSRASRRSNPFVRTCASMRFSVCDRAAARASSRKTRSTVGTAHDAAGGDLGVVPPEQEPLAPGEPARSQAPGESGQPPVGVVIRRGDEAIEHARPVQPDHGLIRGRACVRAGDQHRLFTSLSRLHRCLALP